MKLNNLLIACFTIFSLNAKADSPITSIYFSSYYTEYDIVTYAMSTGLIDDKIAAYLAEENNLIDVKAAIINALGWAYDGKTNAALFKAYLASKRGITADKLSMQNMSGHELFCMGYLMAMDDYFEVDSALLYAEAALAKLPKSYTAAMIHAIIFGQKNMDANWCMVWQPMRDVIKNTKLKRDIKTAAIQAAVDYLILYKSYCTEE
jgi:hypothetical protein